MSDKDNKDTKGKNPLDTLIEGHEYDGIKEYNNPAPFWWQLFFYASIIFAVGYFVYYQMLGGPTLDKELKAKMAGIQKAQIENASQGPDEKVLLAAMASPEKLKAAQGVFAARCAACHATDGGGSIGPNLTDEYWLHGGKITEVYHTIRKGVLDKGMPAWESLLSEDEMVELAAYVKSLKGKPVASAKAPQGEKSTD